MRALFRGLAVAAVLVLGSAEARAQTGTETAASAAAAEDLFQNARRLFAEKKFAEACPLFAESYRLDAGGGTLQNLAVCYEELGKTASAYARFEELRTLSKNAEPPRLDRVKLADEHIAKLTPLLSRIRLTAKGDRKGLVVKIDDVIYSEVSWAAGVLLDPGPHAIVVTAPGKKPYSVKATAHTEGGFVNVEIPGLEDQPDAHGPATDVPLQPETHPQRTAGFVVGGVGLAALGAGAVFGVLTLSANQAGKDRCSRAGNPGAPSSDFDGAGHCFAGTQALADANQQKDRARTFGTVSTVLMPVGIVALALGTYFVLRSTPRQPEKAAVRVYPSLGGLVREGEL